MLARILAVMRQADRPLCLADLERVLDVDGGALEGMIDTLVAKGRLRPVLSRSDGCGGCPIRSGCFLMADGVAVTYALVPPASCSAADGGALGQAAAAGEPHTAVVPHRV